MVPSSHTPNVAPVQHFRTGTPTAEWTIEELTIYAQAQCDQIQSEEHTMAVAHWRLGQALNMLRKNFHHGHWEKLLKDLRLEKSKASRARALAKTFATEQEVAGLTVKEAYDRRARPQRRAPKMSGRPNCALKGLRQFLTHVAKKADSYLDEAAFADGTSASETLPAVAAAIEKLRMLQTHLGKQADESRVHGRLRET
jgi:hypothetical protein